MRAFCCLAILISSNAFGQIREITEKEYQLGIEELERKLTFTYYSPEIEAWWINKFNYNEDNKTIVMKNTSAKNPNKLAGKKYIVKTFRLSDLNPYAIEKIHVDKNAGRLVKGEEIVLHTVKHKNLVGKTINNQRRTPQSYVQLAIPNYMEDSTHVTDSLIQIFEEVIQYATNLKRSEEPLENMNAIFQLMLGEHEFENSVGKAKRFTKKLSDYSVQYEDYQNRKKIKDGIFGFDPTDQHYYEMTIAADGAEQVTNYALDASSLLLVNQKDSTEKIHFPNKSLYYYQRQEERVDMKPL